MGTGYFDRVKNKTRDRSLFIIPWSLRKQYFCLLCSYVFVLTWFLNVLELIQSR